MSDKDGKENNSFAVAFIAQKVGRQAVGDAASRMCQVTNLG